MVFDRTENEPDEYDPEADFRDPDSDSLTIPRVPTEDAGSDLRSDLKSEFEEDFQSEQQAVGTEVDADVDGDLLTTFWALVLVINVAVIAFSLGLLFLIFEGAITTASYLIAAGLVLTGFAIRRYRNVQRELESADDDFDGDDDAGDDDSDTDDPPADGESADSSADGAETASGSHAPADGKH